MSALKQLNKQTVVSVAATLKQEFKKDVKEALADMKEYLRTTNLSEEEKLKQYANFSADLHGRSISETMMHATNLVINDAQLYQQNKLNNANISLLGTQDLVAKQDELIKKEEFKIRKEDFKIKQKQLTEIDTKIKLMIIETQSKVQVSNSQILSEARRNGATVVSTEVSETIANITMKYQYVSLTAVSANDKKGLYGFQIALADMQSSSFRDHTKVQIANQMMQLSSQAIAEGFISIKGLMNSHKTLCESLIGDVKLDSSYTTISK